MTLLLRSITKLNRMRRKPLQFPDTPPGVWGVIVAIGLSLIRSISNSNSLVKKLIEAATCGVLTLSAHHAILAFNYDTNLSVFAGGVIGLVGSDAIKALAIRIMDRKS